MDAGPRCLINGVAEDSVSVTDRGLSYGDGLFETIAVRDGAPCLWSAHMDRLYRGARRLGISTSGLDRFSSEAATLLADADAAVLKLILTRGPGPRGYGSKGLGPATRILLLDTPPPYPEAYAISGVAVRCCRTPLSVNAALAGVKHLNRLEQVLARREWDDPEIAEGLMCDDLGRVVCGTMANLFVLEGGRLSTPRLDRCGIAGTVRRRVLIRAAEFGMPVSEVDLPRPSLAAIEGAFLTNALIGVWPVRAIDGRPLPVDVLPRTLLEAVVNDSFLPEPD